jgi:hypothetical protein
LHRPQIVFDTYVALLQHLDIPYPKQVMPGFKSYNFICTGRWCMVVPRTRENYEWFFHNSLAFCGIVIAHSEDHIQWLRTNGVIRTLEHVTYPVVGEHRHHRRRLGSVSLAAEAALAMAAHAAPAAAEAVAGAAATPTNLDVAATPAEDTRGVLADALATKESSEPDAIATAADGITQEQTQLDTRPHIIDTVPSDAGVAAPAPSDSESSESDVEPPSALRSNASTPVNPEIAQHSVDDTRGGLASVLCSLDDEGMLVCHPPPSQLEVLPEIVPERPASDAAERIGG